MKRTSSALHERQQAQLSSRQNERECRERSADGGPLMPFSCGRTLRITPPRIKGEGFFLHSTRLSALGFRERVEALKGRSFQSHFLLTLPRPEGRGFFLHPACLRGAAVRRRVAAGCPEAFDETPSSVPVCPTVPCSALCKIFKAAL